VGAYRPELQADGKYLFLAVVEDACPGRSREFGVRWNRYEP
jgi:hypothetical protein